MGARDDLGNVRDILFSVRQPKGPHWYENMGYAITDIDTKTYGPGWYLCILPFRTIFLRKSTGAGWYTTMAGGSSSPTAAGERIAFTSMK